MLLLVAEFMALKEEKIHVPMIFYAGEALSKIRQDYISEVWGTRHFGSAGYASVDAGVIGYQCKYCGPGEHHLFSDLVKMNIINGEAIISSSVRNSLPIYNYQTGDSVIWLDDCNCGSSDKRFKLLGRLDSTIQVWSCRLLLSDIELCMNEAQIMTFQIHIHESKEAVVREKISFLVESHIKDLDHEKLLFNIYHRSRDLRDTILFKDFKSNVSIKACELNSIPRNDRTGKISIVIDHRRS
jgi:phenylacetate-coenzyme A ligase PaaK-like adenylate-forming protein